MPRRDLRIEIDDPNDQQNPSTLPIPITNQSEEPDYHQRALKNNSSMRSLNSNVSNKSEREIILERSQKQLIQSRLSRNIQSLNKLNLSLSKSRASSRRQKKLGEESIQRSRSTSQVGITKSRAKILNQISQKLEGVRKNAAHKRDTSNAESRVTANAVTQRENNRSTKLNSLLQQIKKSNQESNKPVYTIKKSKMESKKIHSGKKNVGNEQGLKDILKQLKYVRKQLEEAKRKNQQLIELAKGRDQQGHSRVSAKSHLNGVNHGPLRQASIDRDGYKKYAISESCPTCGCTCKNRAGRLYA